MEACAQPSICNPEFLFALTIDAGAGMENRDRLAHRRWNLLRQSWVTASLHRDDAHPVESTNSLSPSLSLAEPVRSSCRMLSYYSDHSLTLPRMKREEIRHIVDAWIGEIIEQANSDWVQYVQIVENSGAAAGAANPHPHPRPHAEIWSTASVPAEPAAETRSQREHLARTGRCLLCDYVAAERVAGQRVVFENDHFIALVPWWAASPFEVLLISRRHARALPELHRSERDGLADALKSLTTRYDNLFETSLAYAMDFHQAPVNAPSADTPISSGPQNAHPEWHLHAHFYPQLLGLATPPKFIATPAALSIPLTDFTPETAAYCLRNCSDLHFSRPIPQLSPELGSAELDPELGPELVRG